MALRLYGLRYSVYTRVARMTLAARDLDYQLVELNPFLETPDPVLARVSPFGRIPVLDDDGFLLCETVAITRYLASAFPGAPLWPTDPKAEARAAQVIAVIDAHGYWPMVRQVFSHAVFRPLIGAASDPALIAQGVAESRPVLEVLETIAAEGLVLDGQSLTLADLHLAPMLGYFTMAEEGRILMRHCPALGRWWQGMQADPLYHATDPGLATLAGDA